MKKIIVTAALALTASAVHAHQDQIIDGGLALEAIEFVQEEKFMFADSYIRITIANTLGEPVTALKTTLVCKDVFGDTLFKVTYKDTDRGISAGGNSVYEFSLLDDDKTNDRDADRYTCFLEDTQVAK